MLNYNISQISNITAQTSSESDLKEECFYCIAQRLTHKVSSKFIPLATKKDVILDTMVGIKKLNNTVRWKEYQRTKR